MNEPRVSCLSYLMINGSGEALFNMMSQSIVRGFWRAEMCGMNRAEGGQLIVSSGDIDHRMSASDARCHRRLHLHASRCSLHLDRERFPLSFHKKNIQGRSQLDSPCNEC